MVNKGLNKGMLIAVTIAVAVIAVAYYFWETFLFEHYLGGYDEFGLPIQRSHPGFYFLLHAWPLWVFPLIFVFIVLWLLRLTKSQKADSRIKALEKELKLKEKELDSLRLDLELTKKEVKKTRIERNLKQDYQELEEEFEVLMEEYQQSQKFIEKLLAKINSEE